MARRRFGFKPSLRQQMRQSAAACRLMALGSEKPLTAHAEAAMVGPAPSKSRVPRPDIERMHAKPLEGEVLRDIRAMLAEHPLVLIAVRQNSGAASYEAATGRYAPVRFYEFIKRPEKMRIVDVWGLLITGRFFAIEVKRADWKGPTDDREREQAAFLEQIKRLGGIAGFARSRAEAAAILAAAL